MTNNFKRTCALLLLACASASCVMTACGDSGNTPAVTGAAPSGNDTQAVTEAVTEAAPLYDDKLPETDMGGFKLTFLNYTDSAINWALKDINREAENGDQVNDAIYQRNRRVEERFNAQIGEIYTDNRDTGVFRSIVMAGDTDFDLAEIYDELLNSVHTSGVLETWDIMPHIDLSREWWNQDANVMFRIGDQQYAAVGDFNLSMYSKSYLYFVNKDLYKSIGFDDNLYELVKNGKWTKDKLLEIAKQGAKDLDGDGKMGDDDQYGLAETTKIHYQMLITGAGYKFVDIGKDGMPYFAVPGNEKMLSMMQELLGDHADTSWYYRESTPMGGVPDAIWEKGRTLFVSSTMWNTEKYRDYNFDIGMIPAPKYDEAQDRYYSITIGGMVTVIPKSIRLDSVDNIGILMEALAADSHYNTLPVYKEVTLQSKYARDEGSAEMVDIIFGSQVYDLGVTIWTNVRSTYMEGVFHKLNDTLVSKTESLSKSIEKSIQKTIDALEK